MKASPALSMLLGVLAGCGSPPGAGGAVDVGSDAPTGGPSFTSNDAGGVQSLDAAIEQRGVTVKLITLSCAGSCATVQAVGIGGVPPYTYAWEDGSTDPVRTVCPTADTAYSVRVTDTGTTGELARAAQTADASVTARILECLDGGASTTGCDSLAKVSLTQANPSGAWSYGASPALGGAFSLYTQSLVSPAAYTGFDMWTSGVAGFYPPCAYFNSSSSPITDSTFTAQPGQFMLHPGLVGQYSVARWTAPKAGRYVVHASFEGVDQGPTTTDVHVQHNGADIATGPSTSTGPATRSTRAP